jgi:predicted nucleotidyltransferase
MLDLSETITPLILERHQGVRAVYLFGSRATGMIHPTSDWDFAILGDPIPKQEQIDTAGRLASLLESEVDLVDLSAASTALRFQVIATGRPIRILDQVALETFEMETLTAYQNLNESRKAILRDFGMAA